MQNGAVIFLGSSRGTCMTNNWSYLLTASEFLKIILVLSLIMQENLYQQLFLADNFWKNEEGFIIA